MFTVIRFHEHLIEFINLKVNDYYLGFTLHCKEHYIIRMHLAMGKLKFDSKLFEKLEMYSVNSKKSRIRVASG